MANRFVGLDPTWAHLPAPAPIPAGHCHSTPSFLFPAAAFENEALTSALRASMSPANASAAASSSYPGTPATPSSSSTSSASELLSGGHVDAPAPSSRAGRPPARAAPKGGRVTKRKARPSTRRPPPTYITADPANFRRMVQEITGLPVASDGARVHDFAASGPTASASASAAAPIWPTPLACALPTLDTSAFLLDHAAVTVAVAPAPVKEEKSSSGGALPAVTAGSSAAAVEPEEDDCSLLLNLEAMESAAPAFLSDDFPTLESWGIM